MTLIHVHTASSYDVMISGGLMSRAGEMIAGRVAGKHALIVSDDRVFPLYGEGLEKSLKDAGIETARFVFPSGEESKSLRTYGDVLECLCEARISRGDMLLTLGGGVVGDLGGFAASTYLRGIDFIQIPTTLLAAVDSSTGGKTAINLSGGKNQAGSFYQPRLVLTDIDALKTLPEDEYKNGCAEIVKYAVLSGEEAANALLQTPVRENYERVIASCVAMKRDLVEKDERDKGERALLNLGHSFGHAAEKLSGYAIPHGRAVAMGLAAIARAAARLGYCEAETRDKILALLRAYQLPTQLDFSPEAVADACLGDKKRFGDTIRLIVPRALGHCEIVPTDTKALLQWAKAGIEP